MCLIYAWFKYFLSTLQGCLVPTTVVRKPRCPGWILQQCLWGGARAKRQSTGSGTNSEDWWAHTPGHHVQWKWKCSTCPSAFNEAVSAANEHHGHPKDKWWHHAIDTLDLAFWTDDISSVYIHLHSFRHTLVEFKDKVWNHIFELIILSI